MSHFVPSTMLSTEILFQNFLPKLFIELKAFHTHQHTHLHPYINPPSNIQRPIHLHTMGVNAFY